MRRPRLTIAPLVLGTLLGSIACSSTNPYENLGDCTGDVALSVGGGTQPLIHWEPLCRAYLLVVESAATGHDSWSITSAGGNGISPDVLYGTAPAGAQTVQAAAPLVAGQTYVVALRRYAGAGNPDGILIGTKTFTP